MPTVERDMNTQRVHFKPSGTGIYKIHPVDFIVSPNVPGQKFTRIVLIIRRILTTDCLGNSFQLALSVPTKKGLTLFY